MAARIDRRHRRFVATSSDDAPGRGELMCERSHRPRKYRRGNPPAGNAKCPQPASSSEAGHGQDNPPPQCRWGAFENPQFKWVPETLERLASNLKEPNSVPYGLNVGSPKGPPLIEHGRGSSG